MSALASHAPVLPALSLSAFVARLRADEPRFAVIGLLHLAAILPTAFAALVDPRLFHGVGVWDKPLKFEFALAVYLLTLAFFARFVPEATRQSRWYRVYASTVVVAVVAEMVWIAGAAMLGTSSHFNATPAGAALYSLMGLCAVLLTSPTLVYAWAIARNGETGLSPVLKDSIVLGLGLVLPLTLMTAGTMASSGSHAVGGTGSDAGGLALMGWLRDAGDLRVAHFFATHALHFIPAFGLASALVLDGQRRAPVWAFSALFVAFVVFTFSQALGGRPFLPGLG